MLWLAGPVRIYGIWKFRFAVMLKGCRDRRPFSISLYAIDGWTAVLLPRYRVAIDNSFALHYIEHVWKCRESRAPSDSIGPCRQH